MKTLKLSAGPARGWLGGKKLILGIAITLTVGVFLSSAIAYAGDKPNYVPGEIIVKFKAEVAYALEQQIADKGRSRSMAKVTASLVIPSTP